MVATHTHTQPFFGSLDFVQDNLGELVPEKRSPAHIYCGHQSSLICFLRLLWSMASSLFNLRAWQSFSIISVQVFVGCHYSHLWTDRWHKWKFYDLSHKRFALWSDALI